MPRPSKGARLWFDSSAGTWCIRDRSFKRNLGIGRGDQSAAEAELSTYLAQKYRPAIERRADALRVADVLIHYARTVAPTHRNPSITSHHIDRLAEFWSGKFVAEINRSACGEYVAWRQAQPIRRAKREEAKRPVGVETVRRELQVLSAALGAWHADFPLPALPVVTLPPKPAGRSRWLTRAEAARFLRAARQHPDRAARKAIIRFFLLAIYTGSRSDAIRSLSWYPTPVGGWVDLERGIIHRRGSEEKETNKRRPPLRIPDRLIGSLRRWKDDDHRTLADAPRGWLPPTRVIHYHGLPVEKQRRAWSWVIERSGLGEGVLNHTLRHTAITWAMLSGIDLYDASRFFGVSTKILEDVYGHHHPDFQAEIASKIGRRRQ
jgi:hypothetical protein